MKTETMYYWAKKDGSPLYITSSSGEDIDKVRSMEKILENTYPDIVLMVQTNRLADATKPEATKEADIVTNGRIQDQLSKHRGGE